MDRAPTREELLEMLRLLYAEVVAHGTDYHHVTPPGRLERVRAFLLGVDGRLPDPAPLPVPEPGEGTGDEP